MYILRENQHQWDLGNSIEDYTINIEIAQIMCPIGGNNISIIGY